MKAMQQQRSSFTAALVVSLILAAGCSSGGGGGFNLMSLEDEWRLGQQLEADIARQMRIVNDPIIAGYVNKVGQRMVRQTAMANLPWKFHVVNDPEINAFNIPGGHVYVTTGLIAATDSASELAGVMSHEIAHGVERHATEQMSKAYGLNILAAVLLGQNPPVYQQILAQILGTGAIARFSRTAENEADDLGVRFMYQAGYDPRGMVTMFEELLSRRQRAPGSIQKFFATHPLTEDRISNVTSEIAKLPPRSDLITTEAEFTRVRNRVRG